MYIIGRSGSGKTNLIRVMAMQDLLSGSGIGIIAPEQELLTEEVLPEYQLKAGHFYDSVT